MSDGVWSTTIRGLLYIECNLQRTDVFRFRVDNHFIFQVFGVIQKRQVCASAALHVKKSTYLAHREIISNLTAKDFNKASEEEARGLPFSNQAIRILRQNLKAIRTRVKGTDESRHKMKSHIWGTNLVFNSASLWNTVNPTDTQDPTAQVIAGEKIDLGNFSNLLGPDNAERARNIAKDPYAAAKYFHFTIDTLLEVLFGFKKSGPGGTHTRTEGAFGKVQAYVGTVEAQQRGTLHLHMLVWLEGTPNTDDFRRALNEPRFRLKIENYIRSTIHADLNKKNDDAVRAIVKQSAVSYSRPFQPSKQPEKLVETREALARALQFHLCQTSNCLRPNASGQLTCKRGAPFALAVTEWVNSKGEWGPMRYCGYLNNWNDVILFSGRCNHDVKLIVNGVETCVLVLYTGNYATKKQVRQSNVSALLENKFTVHRKTSTSAADLVDNNKLLLQRCTNALFTQKEFSGPEIVALLMGWGDSFESHTYAPIYWDAALSALYLYYPELRPNL